MNVLVVGLGLMGGSYAKGLKDKGHYVMGSDRNQESIKYAIENGYIDEGNTEASELIKKSDLIILAFYPKAVLSFLEKYKSLFTANQIITDISGVKTIFVEKATEISKPAVYLSHHPMSGREKIGIENSKYNDFTGANFLITPIDPSNANKHAIEVLEGIGKDLGFGRITIISIYKHDNVVGFTSQLTHAIAVSLVNSDKESDTKSFIGDSYRDLTRIAKINENLWSELFLSNKEYLLKHIESFEDALDELKSAVLNDDKNKLEELFKHSTSVRKEMDK